MRPLNKKYFGNRNIGTNGYQNGNGDDGIGGEGLATYTLPVQLGSVVINANYDQPILVVPAPTIPGGVQATATVVWEVESVTVTNGLAGHGYTTTANGATTLTGLGGGATFNITAVGSGQGEVQTIIPYNRGNFTTVPTAAVTYQIVGGDGNNQSQVKFRVKSITTVQKGSGYTGAETFSWDDGGSHSGTMPGVPTVTLTADSGAGAGIPQGNANNQENAIIINANTGNGNEVGDIIKQVNDTAFKVKTAFATKQKCLLVATDDLDIGEAFIKATDTNGNTYFVTKITAHVATVKRWTQNGTSEWLFADGGRAKWTFDAEPNEDQVTVENA